MIRKRLLCVFMLMLALVSVFADNRQHVVKPGDTLYSLSKHYGVTVEDIQAANPAIEGTNIPAGMTLVIPDAKQVGQKAEKKKEKAILFNFRKKDKKKDDNSGKTSDEAKAAQPQPDVTAEAAKKPEEEAKKVRQKVWGAPDNIVIIMPFNLDAKTAADEKLQMRSVEFYEGLLLAVNEAQKNGQKILVQTYDLGTKSLPEILATQSLLDADLIVAPMDMEDVKQVAEFGKQNDIEVVSPFVFSHELSAHNSKLIQLNTSKSMLYDNLTNDVITRFDAYDFVFLDDKTYATKADPYAAYLKKELKSRNKPYHEFEYDNPELLVTVDSALNIVDHNILYIPVANSKEALRRMFPCLKCTTFEVGAEQEKQGQTAILGYPEWVLFVGDFMDYYYDMNVYMFSKFYSNPLDEKVKDFYKNFRYWYAKEPMSLTPRYALLGYDIGKYFLAAIRKHGRSFGEHLEGFSNETLQSMMSFRRDGEGLINHGLYLVHFTPSTEIEKYEIK